MPDRDLRVALVLNQFLGWSQNFITRELVQLAEEGVDVRIFAREIHERDDLADDERALLANAVRLPENPLAPAALARHAAFALSHPRLYGRGWLAFLRAGHDVASKRARSLICLARAASSAGQIRALDVDLIHAHFLTAPGELARFLSVFCERPYGATAHAMDIYRDTSGNARKIGDAAYLATCTHYNAEHLRALNATSPERVHTIYHGLSDLPDARPVPPGRFAFLGVGRLVSKKGFDILIQSCRQLADLGLDFECRFAGTGPLEGELRAQVTAAGLDDRVFFSGFVPPTEMKDAYRVAHALVMPSVVDADGDRDGIPNVCLEAMSHGLPIIGTRVSGIPEVIEDGVTGYLVPQRNVEALTAAMAKLLARDDLPAMGARARQIIAENFEIVANVRALLDVMRANARDRARKR